MVTARDLGGTDDPWASAMDDVEPYRGLTPQERYQRFLDIVSFMERVFKSIDPDKRARYDRARMALDDPGRWWERVPRHGPAN